MCRVQSLATVDGAMRFVVRCQVERVLVEGGRAAGVEGTYADEDGRRARVVVRAPTVVVAGGALESPALLLRSGIGGPAVGEHLRLHPATFVAGLYDGPQQGWWGAPQSGLCDHWADLEDGYGHRPDDEEDRDAAAVGAVLAGLSGPSAPLVRGVRVKSLEAATRLRG